MAPEKKDAEKPFNWDDYLKKTKGVKAPKAAFSQPDQIPKNLFKEGQLILAKDNHAHLMVLSKIRVVYKCWIYIHIEGLDDTHCRWVLCDDKDIEPVGPRNEKLKFDHRNAYPPTGLKSNFRKWIVQQYEGNEDIIADASLFHPLDLKTSPQKELFQVGMKLAAYDDKSFDGNLTPATIVDVTKTTMKLNFDGWPSSYDITVPLTSRCIFPIDLIKGTDLTINAPRVAATQDSAKGHRELRKTRNSTAAGQIKKEEEEEEEEEEGPDESEEDEDEEEEEGGEGGGPPSKRKRLGFFDPANKPMRPGQRAAAMKEQVTGVKAKVIDLLREATEAQEREDSSGRNNQHPPKLVPMTKVVKVNTPVNTVNTVRQEPVRTIVPKPVVVYQSLDPSRQQVFHTVRPTVQQIQNDGRVVTVARAPKTLVPGNTLARIVTVPITTSGDVVRADPSITSALRQSLLDDSVASTNIQKNGHTSHTNTPRERGPSATAVVTTSDTPPTLRRVFAQGDTVLVEHPKQVLRPMEPTSSRNHHSNDSHPSLVKRAVTVRPLMQQSSSHHHPDALPVRRIDPNQPLYTATPLPRLSMNSPSILTHKKTIAPRPFQMHHKPPQREPSMPVLQPMASTSTQEQVHPEPKQQPMNNNSTPTPAPAPAPVLVPAPAPAPQVKPVPMDVPPPLEKRIKVEEYKLETKTVHKDPNTADIKMYVSRHCKMGPLLCAEKVIQLNDYPEMPYPIQIQRVIQDLIYCAWFPREVFDKLPNLSPDTPSMKVTIRHDVLFLTKNVPIHLSSVTAMMWLRDFLVSINCCPNAISGSEFACENCAETDNDVKRKPPRDRTLKYRREHDVLKKLGAKLPDVDEVANEYRKRMGSDMGDLIKENLIDSSVLPYCQEDLLREQMKIPYNVALRMAAVACELRALAFESVPGIETMNLDLK